MPRFTEARDLHAAVSDVLAALSVLGCVVDQERHRHLAEKAKRRLEWLGDELLRRYGLAAQYSEAMAEIERIGKERVDA